MPDPTAHFNALLHAAPHGLPQDFSVVAAHQLIPAEILREVDRFIDVFERVTTRPAWVKNVLEEAPPTAQLIRNEVCFFSAWDFHLPPGGAEPWQLIEFNDNGSGFLFAALINSLFFYCCLADAPHQVVAPTPYPQLCQQIQQMINAEARRFFGQQSDGLLLILDDADSLQRGKFRTEHRWLAAQAHTLGWQTAISSADRLHWDGQALSLQGRAVAFIVNRSTDFLWQDPCFAPLLAAYRAGRVYVAPNPFTYATRSDKRLLEYLSQPERDTVLGIQAPERDLLDRHVPPSYLLTPENVAQLARHKTEFIFKPAHSHAGLGVLAGQEVGRHRLQRLLARGRPYIAQRFADKSCLMLDGNTPLWCDLRVWAYRGQRFLISGRASCRKERLDLQPPGGWLPTFVQPLAAG